MAKKKVKSVSDSVEGYAVGDLTMRVQAVPRSEGDGKLVKGVFCTLHVRKELDDGELGDDEAINFAFALASVREFKAHVVSIINNAIKLKVDGTKKVEKKTKKTTKK